LVNYSAEDARKVLGLSSARIAEALGYIAEPELIHRDNLLIS
jgi:glutamate 5-kinase